MNPRTNEDELHDQASQIHQLETRIVVLEGEAKLLKFIVGAVSVSVIALIVNALGEIIF